MDPIQLLDAALENLHQQAQQLLAEYHRRHREPLPPEVVERLTVMWLDTLEIFAVGPLHYRATKQIVAHIDRDIRDQIMALAEMARRKRGVEIARDTFYYVRFQNPPHARLIVCVFLATSKNQRYNFIAYYDEIEHLLQKGLETGDVKQLPGNPFTEMT